MSILPVCLIQGHDCTFRIFKTNLNGVVACLHIFMRVNSVNGIDQRGYPDSVNMAYNSKVFRIALFVCLLTACWFAVGGSLKTWLAHSNGKTIEIVVCSGSGLKKVYVPLPSSKTVGQAVSVKHCSNTPLALATEELNTLKHLAYAWPTMQTIWHSYDRQCIERDGPRDAMRPPGRAPPAYLLA
jgi:hypothetical protein